MVFRIFSGRVSKREMTKLIAINIGVLCFGLLLLELVFGDWLAKDNLNHLMLIRNSDWIFRMEDDHPYAYPQRQIYYSRDKDGLRGLSFTQASEVRILTLGGSTTDQRYINEGETWQDVMANRFQEKGFNIPVANAGVDGHSTYGHLLALDQWIPNIENLQPEFFLFYIGVNDLFRLQPNEYDLNLGYYFDDGLHPIRRFMQKSALYYVFRVTNGILAIKSKKAGHTKVNFGEINWGTQHWDNDRLEKVKKEQKGFLSDYSRRVKSLCALTRSQGAVPIFVTQSSARGLNQGSTYDFNPEWGDESVYRTRALNESTIDACRSCEDSICIDLARELVFSPDDYYDGVHNTPNGTRKIGVFLAERMLPYVSNLVQNARQ